MEYKVLTLNLHTYQEEVHTKELDFYSAYKEQIHSKIASFIEKEEIDFILFQEVGQHKDEVIVEPSLCFIKKYNAMKEILDLCHTNYYFSYDFAHYGWNIWEEGVGIVSKVPFSQTQSLYVSKSKDLENFQSRKLIIGQCEIDGVSFIVCSVHLNWWNQGFQEEVEQMIKELKKYKDKVLILGGDFNNAYHTEGYTYFIKRCKEEGIYLQDSYLVGNPMDEYQPTIREDAFAKNQRIDYIFLSEEQCVVKKSSICFSDDSEEGRVSDHYGVLTSFLLKEKE